MTFAFSGPREERGGAGLAPIAGGGREIGDLQGRESAELWLDIQGEERGPSKEVELES